MAEKTIALTYTGSHPTGQYLPDVPPRDLSEAEAARCGYSLEDLVATGFYAPAQAPAPAQVQTGQAPAAQVEPKKKGK